MKLEVKNLSKKYGSFYALKDFSAVLSEGVYGLLGPNGAGKSTLMNILTDNLERTSGEILLDGQDISTMGTKYRSLIGYMPQQQGFYEQFTAGEFLCYIGELKNVKKAEIGGEIDRLLKRVNLYEYRNKKLGGFSGGMRQRVLLAQALLGNPQILILDEPTAGLDPKERINMRNVITEISRDKIILIATHIVSDIEFIADEILLIKNGECILEGNPMNLITSIRGKVGECRCTKEELPALQERYGSGNVFQREDGIYFRKVGDALPNRFQVTSENITMEEAYLYYLENDLFAGA